MAGFELGMLRSKSKLAMAGFELGMLHSKSKRSIVLAWSLNCYTDAAVDPINSSYMFRSQQRE